MRCMQGVMSVLILIASGLAAASGFLTPVTADALSIRVHPGEVVYLSEESPERNLYSVVVQTVAVLNDGPKACKLESIHMNALRGGKTLLTLQIPQEDIAANAKRISALAQQGVLQAYDFYFQTSKYLPKDVSFATSDNIEPNSAILVSGKSLLVPGNVEKVSISASCATDLSEPATAEIVLKAKVHQSPNEYFFPLAGTVYIGAAASLHSHHRWVTNEEFALDLGYLQGNGETHSGDGTKLSQYHAYGKDVVAAADGVVVDMRSDVTESDQNLRQPGEDAQKYDQRVLVQQNQLLAKGYKEPLGNYVILKHAGNEFSHYAHLKAGSVSVKMGESVKRGQVIGKLGHSGNSTEPHLHFQITDGPDPMYSRGIPVTFRNIFVEMFGYENRHLQTGWLVTTK